LREAQAHIKLINIGHCPVRLKTISVSYPNYPRGGAEFAHQSSQVSKLLKVNEEYCHGVRFAVDHSDNASPIKLKVTYEDPMDSAEQITVPVPFDGWDY